jgi:hypothetical protein
VYNVCIEIKLMPPISDQQVDELHSIRCHYKLAVTGFNVKLTPNTTMAKASLRYTEKDQEQFDVLKKVLSISTTNKALIQSAYETPRLLAEVERLEVENARVLSDYNRIKDLIRSNRENESELDSILS